METSGFRPDHHQSHVPQQSRRDKLRVQQVLSSTPISHHLDNLSNSLDHQFTLHQDHVNLHARNVRHHSNFLYDQHGMINSSEILDFSRNTSAVLQQHRNALTYQDLGNDHRAMGGTGSDVPPSFMINWSRSLNPNAAQSFDNWPAVTNFASANSNSLALGSGNNEANGVANVVASAHDMATLKPGRVMAQPSLAHVASTTQVLGQDVGQKYYLEAMNLATPSSTSTDHLNYHNNNNNNC